MALTFHDGFETGGAEAWNSVTGTPTFIAGAAANGSNYGMRCDTSGLAAYVSQPSASVVDGAINFNLYIASAPSGQCVILGATNTGNIRLNTDRTLQLYSTSNPRGALSPVLDTGRWYRICYSVSIGGTNDVIVWLDGVNVINTSAGYANLSGQLGVISDITADLYFDDFSAEGADILEADLGDIRTLAARPVGQGVDNDAGSDVDDWRDPAANAATYDHIDSDPPNITDYLTADGDTNIYRYSVTMDECGSGNLAGIGGSDEIVGVHFMFFYETEGGGADDYGTKLIVSDGTLTNDNIDDPKDLTWLNLYHADTPSGGNPWTQAYVNSIEMGMASVSSGGKDQWWYEAYAMVAFKVSAQQDVTPTPSALSLTSSVLAPTPSVTFATSVLSLTGSVIAPTSLVTTTPLALALTSSVLAPTIIGDVTFAASVLSLTGSVLAPTPLVAATPSALSLTSSVLAPSIIGDATYTASALALTSSVLAPTIIGDVTFAASALALTVSVIAPIVDISGDVTVLPTVLSLTSSVLAPSIIGDATYTASVLSLTSSVVAPAPSVTFAASALALTSSVLAPTIIGDVTFAASALALTVSVIAPIVDISGDVTVLPTVLSLTSSVLAPSIIGDATYTASVLSLTSSVVAPAPSVTFAASALALTSSVVAPTIIGDAAFAASALSLTASIIAPIVDVGGGVTVLPTALSLTSSIIAPTIIGDATFAASTLSLTTTLAQPAVDVVVGRMFEVNRTEDKIKLISDTYLGDFANYTKISGGVISQAGGARFSWTKITADNITQGAGDHGGGAVSDLQTAYNGVFYHIDETATDPGFELTVEFTDVVGFNWVNIYACYTGSISHPVNITLYNFNTATWDCFDSFSPSGCEVSTGGEYTLQNHDFFVPDVVNYIGSGGDQGDVRVKIAHESTGDISHALDVDVIALYQ